METSQTADLNRNQQPAARAQAASVLAEGLLSILVGAGTGGPAVGTPARRSRPNSNLRQPTGVGASVARGAER